MKRLLVTVGAVASLVCLFSAAEAQVDMSVCLEATPSLSDYERNECALAEVNKATAELDKVLAEALAAGKAFDAAASEDPRAAVETLTAAQTAWEQYAINACAGVSLAMQGGTNESYLNNTCSIELTKRRIADLRQLIELYRP